MAFPNPIRKGKNLFKRVVKGVRLLWKKIRDNKKKTDPNKEDKEETPPPKIEKTYAEKIFDENVERLLRGEELIGVEDYLEKNLHDDYNPDVDFQ